MADKPTYNQEIDSGNALASYVEFWSWVANESGVELTDVSGNDAHGAVVTSNPDNSPVVVSGDLTAFNGEYSRHSSDYEGQPCYTDGSHWIFYRGDNYWILGEELGGMWSSYAPGSEAYPWELSWVLGVTMTRGTADQDAEWVTAGLELRTDLPEYVAIPATQPGTDDFTLIFDYEITNENTTWATTIWEWYGNGKTVALRRWNTEDWENAPLQLTFNDGSNSVVATWSGEVSEGALIPTGTRRLIVAFDRSGNATAWVNGTSLGTIDISDADGALSGMDDGKLGSMSLLYSTWSVGGVIHEVGYLKGYAVTASDVANNAALAEPYGLAASPGGGDQTAEAGTAELEIEALGASASVEDLSQTAEPGTAELEIEALGVSASVEAAGQVAEVGAAMLGIEALGAQGLLHEQFAQVGTAALEIEALGAVGSQWDSTETAGERWLAVAEMADGTIWVGLQPEETALRAPLRRWRESGRTRLLEQGERTLAEVTGETWAVALPAVAEAVVRVHPAGWALAYLGEQWGLWEYEGSMVWTQRAVVGGDRAVNYEIVVHQGEVWVVERGYMETGSRRAYRLSGRTLVPLRAALWPRWLVNWADFGGYCAWYRGRWWGLGPVEEQWGVADHDGQRLRRQSPRGMVDGLHIAETATSRERLELLWNLPAGDDETPGNNWVTWLTWRNQQGQTTTSRELSITGVTAGNSGKIWATGRRWPISGTQQPSRVYLIYTVPLGGLRLEQMELHAGESESAEPVRLEAAILWALRSEQPLRLEGVELHAGESESAEPLRLERVEIEAGRSASAEPLRVERVEVCASGVMRRVLVEEALLYAHPQNVLPEGWGLRHLVSIEAGIANAVRCVVSKGEGPLVGYVRSDLEHLDPADLNSYQRLPLGPGVELERWGQTIRVALAKPDETQVDGVQVVLRRE